MRNSITILTEIAVSTVISPLISSQQCVVKCASNHTCTPTTPDQLSGAIANTQDGVRLDVSANGVWGGSFQKTYFDIRVFNLHAPSNKNLTFYACYRKCERVKKQVINMK